MHTPIQKLLVAVAGASALAGAALSVLPALVVALVTLFYNSAGGLLILLGSLINLLPRPSVPGAGASSLPMFQVLQTGTAAVLSRSAAGTILCAAAFVLLVTPSRRQSRLVWLGITACAVLAAILGGRIIAWTLAPAIALGAAQAAASLRSR
ncbi:MAG TPA: hypothetical protein VE690_02890 [Rhodopila sp.]|nr:hypothetical protein [Rhodopila sp.]